LERWDVIVNARAHQLADGAPLRELLARAALGAEVHVTRCQDDLDRAARAIAARGTRAVVLAGGDGTAMAGVTALSAAFCGEPPPIALAPGGTVGTIARAFGAHGPDDVWSARLLSAVARERAVITPRATLAIRALGSDVERVGFIFGAGLVASFFELYDALPERGRAAAAKLVARVFAGSFVGGALARQVLAPVECTVCIDGVPSLPRAWSLVATSVLPSLGLGMRLTYRAGEAPDRLHVVASPLPPWRLGPQLPRVLAGRRLGGEHHVDALARELTVRFSGDRVGFVLDGDTFQAREISVRCGPALRVLTP